MSVKKQKRVSISFTERQLDALEDAVSYYRLAAGGDNFGSGWGYRLSEDEREERAKHVQLPGLETKIESARRRMEKSS